MTRYTSRHALEYFFVDATLLSYCTAAMVMSHRVAATSPPTHQVSSFYMD